MSLILNSIGTSFHRRFSSSILKASVKMKTHELLIEKGSRDRQLMQLNHCVWNVSPLTQDVIWPSIQRFLNVIDVRWTLK